MRTTALVALVLALAAGATAQAGEPAPLRSLTLDEALAELDARSPTLAQARSRVAEAEAMVTQAAVPLLPTLVAAGGYMRNNAEAQIQIGALRPVIAALTPQGQPVPELPARMLIQPLDAWTASGSARIPLLVPSAWADWKAAQRASEIATASARAARLQLRAALAQAAWAGAASEEIVAASARAVATAEEHRRSAARRVEAGTAAPLSVLKADTEVVRRYSDLVRARAELERSQLALGVLLGGAEPVRVAPAKVANEGAGSVEALTAEALGNRPELEAREAEVQAALAQLKSARLRWAPQLSSSAGVFASDEPYPTNERWGWRVTVDASWALYDGGLRTGKRRAAEAAASGARAAAEAQRLAVMQEVRDALRDVTVAAERLRLAEQQRDFAAAAAASAQRTFEAGVAGSLDVLDANDRLYQAEVAFADARGRLGIARVGLGRALGQVR
jgi:outer membrane protein TolC